MRTFIPVIALAIAITGCSSTPKSANPENTEDQVVGRIDDLGSRPSWVKESAPFRIESGKVISLGSTTIPGDHRVNAAYRVAQNNAKAAIATAIEQRLEFLLQNAEEGTTADTTQVRYIGAEASKLVTSSIRPGNQYWEKVATTRDSGERVTEYRVFATVEMPESEFKQAIFDAIRKSKGQRGISSDFSSKVDKHWDSFVSGDTTKSEQ